MVTSATTLEAAPPPWNPGAAASWSLLFSPIFGAIPHMKNWEAMGGLGKAASSRSWAIASVVMFVVLAVAAFVGFLVAAGLIGLVIGVVMHKG